MTLETYYDIEGNILEALAKSFGQEGLSAIEMQRGEERTNQRLELMAVMLGETEEGTIDPHTGQIYYGHVRLSLQIDLRTPFGQYAQHRATRGKVRSLLAYLGNRGGTAFLERNQSIYQCENIRMAESSTDLEVDMDSQNELSTFMNYEVLLHLLPGSRPAPNS